MPGITEPIFVVVRNQGEAEEAPRAFPHRSLKWVASNAETYAWCCARHAECLLLDEKWIKNEYRSVNRFAYETALRLAHEEKDLERRFFLETHFFDVRTLLIRTLKCLLVLEKFVSLWNIKEIGVFENPGSLVAAVAAHPLAIGAKLSVKFAPPLATRPMTGHFDAKRAVSSVLSRFSNLEAALRFGGSRKRKLIVASGSLTHLSLLLDELRQTCDAMFWENRFNLEKYRYCRSRGIRFVVLPERGSRHPFRKEALFRPGEAIYEGRDLGRLCNAVFAQFDRLGFLNRGFDEEGVFRSFSEFCPNALVLDEDLAIRRTLLIAALERSVPTFVIPHGVPIVCTYEEGETPPQYCKSGILFVNSEFEKRMNKRICYDPSRIAVTGTPRYDLILESKRRSIRAPRPEKILLFCGAIMQPYDFDGFSVISSLMGQRNLAQDFMERYLADIVWAIASKQETRVRIKPHYAEEKLWEKALRSLEDNHRHEVVSHRRNILELVAESDIVLTTPSSVICEAILFEKPVIILDYESDGMAEPYARGGIAKVVGDRNELKLAIEDYLFHPGSLEVLARHRQAAGKYFTGLADGTNTQRAARLVLENLGLCRRIS